jgi:pantothenate kinase-related protein Tda10
LPDGSGVVTVSQVMKDFMARKQGERLKKMMLNGIRASRFTRTSLNKGSNLSVIGKK